MKCERTRLVVLLVLAVGACGGSAVDEVALRREIRAEVLAEIEAQRARRNDAVHAETVIPLELPDVERFRVDTTDAPAVGASSPRVTIVEFTDYQCPFCLRVEPTVARLLVDFPEDVRVVVRNNPLPFHPNAMIAAEAAAEAYAQGGSELFWRMHSLLFANQTSLARADLEALAQQLGMDMAALTAALDSGSHRARIQEDQAATLRVGARGTPSFFINGRPLHGAQPYEEFERVVREELAIAERIERHGIPRERIYARLMEDAREDAPAPPPEAARPVPDATAVYRVPIDGRPTRGRDDALITIVEYGDFQCPFCARVQATLQRIQETYGGDVRIVFRHNPLPFHQDAMAAAEAAEEVRAERGDEAFFRYAEILFTNQGQLDAASLAAYATQVGVSPRRVEGALRDHRHQARILEDQGLARSLGASGTPAFFVNGRNLRGAQPFESFRTLIDEERARAREVLQRGTPRAQLYEALTANGATSPVMIPGAVPTALAPVDDTLYPIAVPTDAPSRGPRSARVTIQIFSDFQCPFCNRVRPTLDELVRLYPSDVRLVWRDYPLAFHVNAMPAAEAAREVFAQGGDAAFWQYERLLFENQADLDEAHLVALARGVPGVDARRVQRALRDHTHQAAVQADMDAIHAAGARIGTPSFFINGRLLQGAQPLPSFRVAIDRELARP